MHTAIAFIVGAVMGGTFGFLLAAVLGADMRGGNDGN